MDQNKLNKLTKQGSSDLHWTGLISWFLTHAEKYFGREELRWSEELCQEIGLLKIATTLTSDNMWAQGLVLSGYQVIGIIH